MLDFTVMDFHHLPNSPIIDQILVFIIGPGLILSVWWTEISEDFEIRKYSTDIVGSICSFWILPLAIVIADNYRYHMDPEHTKLWIYNSGYWAYMVIITITVIPVIVSLRKDNLCTK